MGIKTGFCRFSHMSYHRPQYLFHKLFPIGMVNMLHDITVFSMACIVGSQRVEEVNVQLTLYPYGIHTKISISFTFPC